MKEYKKLLLSNKAWAAERLELDATYFDNLSKEQNPLFLWIGCADSRVPAEEITHADPGDIFVHRNVANMVPPYEPDGQYHSTSAALEFAVQSLRVRDIIVMGHGRCGGIRAALDPNAEPLSPGDFIGKWMSMLAPVADEVARYTILTDKERQTLRLILRGHDAKSSARALGLSVHTVNERLREARRKLGVTSRS